MNNRNLIYAFNCMSENIIINNDKKYGEFIRLKKGECLSQKDFSKIYDINLLKHDDKNFFRRNIKFSGHILVKFGLFRQFYSFKWLREYELISDECTSKELEIDIGEESNGTLEFKIFALDDSKIFIEDKKVYLKKEIEKKHILQTSLYPDLNLCSEEELFIKCSHSGAFYSLENKYIILNKKSSVDFTTYFNSISIIKWLKYTNVKNIFIYLKFKGTINLTIKFLAHNSTQQTHATKIKSEGNEFVIYDIGNVDYDITTIGFIVEAIEDSIIYESGYGTTDKIVSEVRLGIGITTFKREKEVINAVNRLSSELFSKECRINDINITVVDNGGTLKKDDIPEGVTLIHNKNYGGTGGFMRNLLHYQETEKTTHVLFMDDDASCFPESILRTYKFLEHCINNSIAISGAMLSSNIQFIQWENGAWFDGQCHPLHSNLDLRYEENLIENESEESPMPIYGAWWYFAFPLKHVTRYSFPFFVRGDDIQFSYTNNFKIVSLNGIASWQDDFKLKESPLTLYLDLRSHIIHHILLNHTKHSPFYIISFVKKFFKKFNNSYQYDTAKCILLALKHVMKGPVFFEKNLDMSEIRKFISDNCKIEKSKPVTKYIEIIPHADTNIRFKRFTKLIRKITFNGHILPNILLHKKLYKLNKYEIPFADRVFFRKKVIVFNSINNTQFSLTKNSLSFFKNIITLYLYTFLFLVRYKSIFRNYTKIFEEYKNKDKWENFFK